VSEVAARLSKLRGLAKALHFEEGTEEWVTFFDLASMSRKEVPDDIALNRPGGHGAAAGLLSDLAVMNPISAEEAERLLKLIKGSARKPL